jgi:DNA-binding CsgD family transcriptional regulator
MEFGAGEMRRINEVRDALGSTLDLREALGAAAPLLLRIVPADYAALGVSKPGVPQQFDWILAEMPAQFFEAYPELAPHDFVLRSVLAAPGQVLRDSEMIPRAELEANFMYRRARDLGIPLEHVMSSMLHVGATWSSGISLYRSERRPFSERDRAVLVELAPALRNAVRNCRLYAGADCQRRALDALLSRHALATLLLAPSGDEVARSDNATALIEKWFSPAERRRGRPPEQLVEFAKSCRTPGKGTTWRSSGPLQLVVLVHSLAYEGHTYLAVTLREVASTPSAPAKWRDRLTRREYEIVDRVVRGWDLRLVAEDAGCKEWTVKTHLKSVYTKLGVETRSQLIVLATQELLAEAAAPVE